MDAFEFQNPVKIVFGRGKVNSTGMHINGIAKKVLLCFGKSSAKNSGTLAKVTSSLNEQDISWIELSDIKSNPLLSKVREGIELTKTNSIEAVVAVGGGSVMDTAKAIAAGTLMKHDDIWDCFLGKTEIDSALPVITVPTLAASGSEMNGFMVITDEENNLKLAAGSPHVYPAVSILDPELTFSVPADYTAYGGVDAICHLLEPFFNGSWPDTPVQDGITYGLIRAIADATEKCLANPYDYNARANLMWGATLALNGLTKTGVGEHFFPVHMIEHSISAIFDVPHGAGLAALLPGWMEWFASSGHDSRVAELGVNIYDLDRERDAAKNARSTVKQFANWLTSIGCPNDLQSLSITEKDHAAISENTMVQAGIWGIQDYTVDVVMEILARCQQWD